MADPAVPASASAETEETFGPLRHAVRRSTVISAVSPLVWVITVVVLVAIMVIDLAVIGRRQRTVTTKDAVRWVLVYIGLAVRLRRRALRLRAGLERARSSSPATSPSTA